MNTMLTAQGSSRAVSADAPAAVRWCARALELILTVVIAVLLARAAWFVVYGSDAEPLDLRIGSASESPALSAQIDISGLGSSGLFRSREAGDAPVAALPETRLNLTLRGVRRGATPQSGTAILQAPNQGQRTLPVGAEITDGVTLAAVYEDYVVINRRGVRESLYLREASARRAAASAPPSPAVSTGGALTGEPRPDLARELDVEDWQDGLRLAPELVAGDLIGFRVRDNTRLEVLQASGLLRGDVITALNAIDLNSADAAAAAVRQFETADRVEFTVLRNGEAITLEAPLR